MTINKGVIDEIAGNVFLFDQRNDDLGFEFSPFSVPGRCKTSPDEIDLTGITVSRVGELSDLEDFEGDLEYHDDGSTSYSASYKEYTEEEKQAVRDTICHPAGVMRLRFDQYIAPAFELTFYRKDKGWTKGEVCRILGDVYDMFHCQEEHRPGACINLRPVIDEECRQQIIDDLIKEMGLTRECDWLRYFVPCISYSSGFYFDGFEVSEEGVISIIIGS